VEVQTFFGDAKYTMMKKNRIFILIGIFSAALLFTYAVQENVGNIGKLGLIISDVAVKKNNLTYCEVLKASEYSGKFEKIGTSADGKPALLFKNGKYYKPYGLWQSVSQLERGDSIVKKTGTFDYEVYRLKDSVHFFLIQAHDHLPC